MDWIMEIPPEVITGIWIAAGGLVVAIIGLIAAVLVGAKRIVDAQAERQEADLKADSKREDMINAFAVKWEADKDKLSNDLTELQEMQRQSEVSLAEERGKVIILQDTMKHDRETWRKDRQELVDKINSLEKRIAELEHEIQSRDELLDRKDGIIKDKDILIKELIIERDKYKQQLEDTNTRLLALTLDLNEEREKLQDCENDKQKEESKITPLKQPEQGTDNEDKEEKLA